MRRNIKMLAWVALGVISIGSINTFAGHIAMVGEESAALIKENGQRVTLAAGNKLEVVIDDDFHRNNVVKVKMDSTYGYINKENIDMVQIQTEVLVGGAHLRKEPDTQAEVIMQLSKNHEVTAYYKYKDWYFVETVGGRQGYINEAYINEENLYLLPRRDVEEFIKRTDGEFSRSEAVREVFTGKRTNADPQATNNIAVISEEISILTKQNSETVALKAGDRVKMILDKDFHDNDMVQVDMNGTYGYIAKKDIQMEQIQTRILVDGAFLRKDPNPNADIIKKLNENDLVTAYYKYVDWYFIELEDGNQGFIYKTQINESKLYLLQRKTDIHKLNALIGREPAVEAVQWSEASRLLPRGGNAIIEDVYTGKRFGIKRTFGTNHADVETLTKADTAIMKEIWGGFSWERRPVIVHVAGRRLAASMTAMPHAGKDSAPSTAYTSGRSGGYGYGINLDAVKGNGMDGHVDLHFRGSRRHADGRITASVDPKHQAAIDIAAKHK